jgi:hypothetical protein
MQQAHLELVQSIIQKGFKPCIVCSLKSQVKIHDNNMIDIVFQASVIEDPQQHQMLDLYKVEKQMLDIRTDIKLPKEI